ncbi:MAG: glycosyltransferase family 4 protein [Actinobacteria bacterium]|nr:glycosyltransferase family 4 protein [Actinomycetota bacterium]
MSRVPRTLFITNDFPPRVGGFQSYYWGLVQTLHPEDIVIMAPAHPRAAEFDQNLPYRVVRTREAVVWPSPANLRLAERLIDEQGTELVQMGHPLPAGLLGPVLKRRRGLPYIVMLGGAEVTFPATWPVGGQLMRYVMKRASLFIAVSDYTAAAAQRLVFDRVPARTLRPALDLGAFPATTPQDRAWARDELGIHGRLVVCVGRLVPRKGQDVLLEAVGRLAPHMPDLELALVGDGRLAYHLERRAVALGLEGRVHRPGSLTAVDMRRWLAAADVFASPCRVRWGGLEVEGFGIVFVEAALTGLPVLAGRSGGSVEAVVSGESGIVVDGARVEEVAAGLRRLLQAPEARRRELGAAARRLAVRRHDPEEVGRRYRELLNLAAGRTSGV